MIKIWCQDMPLKGPYSLDSVIFFIIQKPLCKSEKNLFFKICVRPFFWPKLKTSSWNHRRINVQSSIVFQSALFNRAKTKSTFALFFIATYILLKGNIINTVILQSYIELNSKDFPFTLWAGGKRFYSIAINAGQMCMAILVITNVSDNIQVAEAVRKINSKPQFLAYEL